MLIYIKWGKKKMFFGLNFLLMNLLYKFDDPMINRVGNSTIIGWCDKILNDIEIVMKEEGYRK